MKTLIIFALITLISYISSQYVDFSYSYECPDDKKIKIGEDVCAIRSEVKGTSTTSNEYKYYIKKKSCGKKKECTTDYINYYNKNTGLNDYIYTCEKKLKLLKIKKKCNYNAECNTGYCNNGKCAAFETCTQYNYDTVCGPDKYCKGYDYSGTDGTCTAYVKEGEEVGSGQCAPGLGNFYDSESKKTICKKYFSLDKGASATSGVKFCKSYFSDGSKCAEITKVDTPDNYCSVTYDNGDGSGTMTGSDTSGEGYLYKTINKERHCLYSTGKKELVDELVKRYNKIKLDKILEKEDCDYGTTNLCDKKYAELNNVYNYYGILKYLNLIKDNGEKNKDKKCEYEFWRSTISSSYVNVYFGFVFALLGLLF